MATGAEVKAEEKEKEDCVKLVSREGKEFLVPRGVARISKTIEASLRGDYRESKGEIKFPEITSQVLEKVVEYLHYKQKYTNYTQPIPEFPIEPDMVPELLMAANFLDC